MKKFYSILVALAFFGFMACAPSTEEVEETNEEATTEVEEVLSDVEEEMEAEMMDTTVTEEAATE